MAKRKPPIKYDTQQMICINIQQLKCYYMPGNAASAPQVIVFIGNSIPILDRLNN